MAASLPLLLYTTLLSLATFSPVSEQQIIPKEQKITVQNTIGDRRDIWVQCWSKDDDLGVKTLPYLKAFVLKFTPSIFGNTVFQCSVTWKNDDVEGSRTQHTIVVYNEEFGEEQCSGSGGCRYRVGLHTFDGPDGVNSWHRLSRRLIR